MKLTLVTNSAVAGCLVPASPQTPGNHETTHASTRHPAATGLVGGRASTRHPATTGRWLFVAALFAATGIASAQIIDKNNGPGSGTLWSDSTRNPLLDRTARNVGDLITIVITENSLSTFKAGTAASKSDSSSVAQKLFVGFLDRIFKPFSISDNSSNKGEGDTNQSAKMSARMSAVVKRVFPNGSMIVEGTRNIMTNRETQIIKLTGIIRRDDIRPDNTVASERLAEAEIRMEGKGLIADRQRRGLLTRILDWLF